MLIFQQRFAYFQNVIEWIFSKLVTCIRKVQMFLSFVCKGDFTLGGISALR